jgi:tetrahydromethanopterin S-methyltransferase subunit F
VIVVAKSTLYDVQNMPNIVRIDTTSIDIDPLVSRLFINRDSRFKVGSNVYKLLYDTFFNHTIDIDLFVRDVKVRVQGLLRSLF